MKLKIKDFEDVMRKATLNYVIPSVQLKFKNKKIISNMMTAGMDSVIILSLNNNVLDIPANESVDFNFSEPNQYIKPFIDLIDESMADIKIEDERIKLTTAKKQKMKFNFSSPDFVSTYNGDQPDIKNWFFEKEIDEELMDKFIKIKKVSSKFGKIYFSIKDKKLFIEATDKQNKFSNSMKFDLGDVDHKDFDLCFNFTNINALLSLISDTFEDFEIKLHITDNEEGGMLLFKNTDGSEYYYFVSKND